MVSMDELRKMDLEKFCTTLYLMEVPHDSGIEQLIISVPISLYSREQMERLLSISDRIKVSEEKISFTFPYVGVPDTVQLCSDQVMKLCENARREIA